MIGKPSDKERLEHMIEAINRILRFTDQLNRDQFLKEEVVQFAVIKNFEIIGEAAYHLPKSFRTENNTIEWRKIIAFRHILVHDYYKVNLELIWKTIENKLLDLKKEIVALMDRLA